MRQLILTISIGALLAFVVIAAFISYYNFWAWI